jgi:hypothetical protein
MVCHLVKSKFYYRTCLEYLERPQTGFHFYFASLDFYFAYIGFYLANLD